MNLHAHLIARLFETPLMVEPAKLRVLVNALGPRLGVPLGPGNPDAPEADDVLSGARPKKKLRVEAGVAVIPVHGSLVHRAGWLDAYSGVTSYTQVHAWLKTALELADVHAILLDVDSSGGEAAGVFDLADAIRAAGKIKPVTAVANDRACSAAYLIAAAAGNLVTSQSATLGSIGVYAATIELTEANAMVGVVVNEIFAGALKATGSPHHEMTAPERAHLQHLIDTHYEIFTAKIAAFRKISQDAVKGTEAGLFLGADAVAQGLADSVGTLDAVFSRLASQAPSARTMEFSMSNKTLLAGLVTAQLFAVAVTGIAAATQTDGETVRLARIGASGLSAAAAATIFNEAPSQVSAVSLAELAAAFDISTADLMAAIAADAEANAVRAAAAEPPSAPDAEAALSTERARISAILDCPEAAGRATLARHLAIGTDMTAEAAAKALAAAPKEAAGPVNPLAAAMSGIPNPDVDADPDGGGDADTPTTRAAAMLADHTAATGITH